MWCGVSIDSDFTVFGCGGGADGRSAHKRGDRNKLYGRGLVWSRRRSPTLRCHRTVLGTASLPEVQTDGIGAVSVTSFQ